MEESNRDYYNRQNGGFYLLYGAPVEEPEEEENAPCPLCEGEPSPCELCYAELGAGD